MKKKYLISIIVLAVLALSIVFFILIDKNYKGVFKIFNYARININDDFYEYDVENNTILDSHKTEINGSVDFGKEMSNLTVNNFSIEGFELDKINSIYSGNCSSEDDIYDIFYGGTRFDENGVMSTAQYYYIISFLDSDKSTYLIEIIDTNKSEDDLNNSTYLINSDSAKTAKKLFDKLK